MVNTSDFDSDIRWFKSSRRSQCVNLGVAQFGSALHLGCKGCGFKSHHPVQHARLVELADTMDLKSIDSNIVRVQIPYLAPNKYVIVLVLDGFEGWSYKPVHEVQLFGGLPNRTPHAITVRAMAILRSVAK